MNKKVQIGVKVIQPITAGKHHFSSIHLKKEFSVELLSICFK